jgi:hypothetical protein
MRGRDVGSGSAPPATATSAAGTQRPPGSLHLLEGLSYQFVAETSLTYASAVPVLNVVQNCHFVARQQSHRSLSEDSARHGVDCRRLLLVAPV